MFHKYMWWEIYIILMPQLVTWLPVILLCVCVCVYYNIVEESGYICGEEPVLLIALLNMFRFCQ
jgi:hypothetical protein